MKKNMKDLSKIKQAQLVINVILCFIDFYTNCNGSHYDMVKDIFAVFDILQTIYMYYFREFSLFNDC